MFCKSCGANVNDGEKFCSNCGTPVEKAEEDTQKLKNNAFYDTGVTQYTTRGNSGQTNNREGYYDSKAQNNGVPVYQPASEPVKKRNHAILLGVLAVVIVGLVGAIGYGVVQLIKLNQKDEIVAQPSASSDTEVKKDSTKENTVSNESKLAFGGHHYQLIEDGKLTWTEAKVDCESKGGYLAVVTSAEEQAFIEEMISAGTKDFYWLGGTDEDSVTNDYLWVTGEIFDYHNWAEGQPDDGDWGIGGRENYIGILRKDRYGVGANTWNDFRDNPNDSRGYICEWNN